MSIEVYPRINEDDVVICAIDPGDEWVGVAVGCRYFQELPNPEGALTPAWGLVSPGWRVYATAEMTPDQFADWFHVNLSAARFDRVTCEMFKLRKDLAEKLAGTEMMTSQLIGYIRHRVRQHNQEADQHGILGVSWTQHSPAIQKGTLSALKRLGVKSQAKADHHHNALSAELHLWADLIRAGLVKGLS